MAGIQPNINHIVNVLINEGYTGFIVNHDTNSIEWTDGSADGKPSISELYAKAEAAQANLPKTKIRKVRNRKLTECDWTVSPDSPLSPEMQAKWRNYRQELRDITDKYSTLGSVIWPQEPK